MISRHTDIGIFVKKNMQAVFLTLKNRCESSFNQLLNCMSYNRIKTSYLVCSFILLRQCKMFVENVMALCCIRVELLKSGAIFLQNYYYYYY